MLLATYSQEEDGGSDCQTIPVNNCRNVAKPNCRKIADEQCRKVPNRECGVVPVKQCRQVRGNSNYTFLSWTPSTILRCPLSSYRQIRELKVAQSRLP